MYITYFTFKPTHKERHYLLKTDSRCSNATLNLRDFPNVKDVAKRFTTHEEALAAMNKLIRAWGYGKDGGYSYTPYVEEVPK